jgi:hypothetical protein
MSLFWTAPLTLLIVGAGTSLCFWLLHKAQQVDSSVWILEQVVCPIIRIVVLLIIVSLVYPAIDKQSTFEFWRMLGQREQFNDLLNILFIVGLGLAFIPLLSHPVIALPIQSMLTIALVFSWQHADAGQSPTLLPSLTLLLKIFGYMLLAYLVTRESSILLSRWIDRRFALDGSIRLVSDAIYLVLQIPVMLIYGSYLKAQLAG